MHREVLGGNTIEVVTCRSKWKDWFSCIKRTQQ